MHSQCLPSTISSKVSVSIWAVIVLSGKDWVSLKLHKSLCKNEKHIFFTMTSAVNRRSQEAKIRLSESEIAATPHSCCSTCLPFVKTITLSAAFLSSQSLRKSDETNNKMQSGEHFRLPLSPPLLLDANFHFNCVKPLFLTSEKRVRVRVLIRESKNTACRIFMLITL